MPDLAEFEPPFNLTFEVMSRNPSRVRGTMHIVLSNQGVELAFSGEGVIGLISEEGRQPNARCAVPEEPTTFFLGPETRIQLIGDGWPCALITSSRVIVHSDSLVPNYPRSDA